MTTINILVSVFVTFEFLDRVERPRLCCNLLPFTTLTDTQGGNSSFVRYNAIIC